MTGGSIKSQEEINIIRESGKITANALQRALLKVVPGVTTKQLDIFIDEEIQKAGGEAAFKKVPGYRWATCMNVNDTVVHGIPTDYKLQDGDRLGIDLGTYYKEFYSDASWSVIVKRSPSTLDNNNSQQAINKFLATGEKALGLAINKCIAGNHIGDISKAMEDTVQSAGYSCVKQLVGHGVGHELHEDPEVPCYVRGKIENTPIIKLGMVLAIEVIYNLGRSEVVYGNDDGWTIVTRDGSISGLFEHTIAVTEKGPQILTA